MPSFSKHEHLNIFYLFCRPNKRGDYKRHGSPGPITPLRYSLSLFADTGKILWLYLIQTNRTFHDFCRYRVSALSLQGPIVGGDMLTICLSTKTIYASHQTYFDVMI
jgi:hypothetical protein